MYKKTNKGYSVVEILIYMAIFAFLSVAVVNSFVTVMSSFTTTRTHRDLLESGSTVMERLTREIRQAKNVDVTNSVFSTSPGTLQLNSTNTAGTATVIKFNTASGALNLTQDGTLVGNLLGQNVSVTSLSFRKITTTNSEAIKIELTLQDTRSKTAQTANFYNTIILRGSY